MNPLNVPIDWIECAAELEYRLGRVPTPQEIRDFMAYLRVDVSQWVTDNAKAFEQKLREEGELN